MHYTSILAFLALSAIHAVHAQEFDGNDVPSQCRSVCDSMIAAARDCDNRFDGDREEVDCICAAPNASSQLPLCEACVRAAQNPEPDDDSDNDIYDVVTSCGFSTTSYNPTAASSGTFISTTMGAGSITSSASQSLVTSTFTSTSTDNDADDDSDNTTQTITSQTVVPASSATDSAGGAASSASSSAGDAASSATEAVGAGTSSAGNGGASAASSATDGAASQTAEAGADMTGVPMLGAGAGLVMAAIGLL